MIARTTRTRPLPNMLSLTAHIGEVRAAAERAGRDPATIEVVVAGSWPMLDIRSGRSPEVFLDEVGTLAELGWTGPSACARVTTSPPPRRRSNGSERR